MIQNFHTLDLYSHALGLTQQADKTAATATTHLLAAWAQVGRPLLHQFDNESTFGGGPTHARVLGHVGRLCLSCQVEPFFPPVYEAKRTHQIEPFHRLWVASFWSRQAFTSLAHVRTALPLLLRWSRPEYQPPALEGKTPAPMRRGFRPPPLTQPLAALLPTDRLPLMAGRIHAMRKVDSPGTITLFNEPWLIGKQWRGESIRATIHTTQQQVSFWHKPDAPSAWRCLKRCRFRLPERVHEVIPEFRRHSERCREYLPG